MLTSLYFSPPGQPAEGLYALLLPPAPLLVRWNPPILSQIVATNRSIRHIFSDGRTVIVDDRCRTIGMHGRFS